MTGMYYVWHAMGGEILGQYRYNGPVEQNDARRKALQHKADIKAGKRVGGWGSHSTRVGVAHEFTLNGKAVRRVVKS